MALAELRLAVGPGSLDEAALVPRLDAAACGTADGRGCRALHYVAWKVPSAAAVAAALAASPDAASAADNAGWLPLHYAAWAKAPLDAVELLLAAHPAAAAATNARGFLPLHMAVQSGAPDAVVGKLLDAHPAGVSAKTNNGDTPLTLATASGADASMLESDEAAVRHCRPLTLTPPLAHATLLFPQVRLARLVALDLPIDADGAPKADGAHGGSFSVVVRDRRCQKALLHLLKPEADGGLGYARHASVLSNLKMPLPSEDEVLVMKRRAAYGQPCPYEKAPEACAVAAANRDTLRRSHLFHSTQVLGLRRRVAAAGRRRGAAAHRRAGGRPRRAPSPPGCRRPLRRCGEAAARRDEGGAVRVGEAGEAARRAGGCVHRRRPARAARRHRRGRRQAAARRVEGGGARTNVAGAAAVEPGAAAVERERRGVLSELTATLFG